MITFFLNVFIYSLLFVLIKYDFAALLEMCTGIIIIIVYRPKYNHTYNLLRMYVLSKIGYILKYNKNVSFCAKCTKLQT